MNERLEQFKDLLDFIRLRRIYSLYQLTDIITSDSELQKNWLWILEDDKLVPLLDLQIVENLKVN